MNILQFIKKFVFNINTLIGIIIGFVLYYTFSRPREGFQTATPPTDTPAACAMIKLILENSEKNLENAKQTNDESNIKKLEASLNTIRDEIKSMSCS